MQWKEKLAEYDKVETQRNVQAMAPASQPLPNPQRISQPDRNRHHGRAVCHALGMHVGRSELELSASLSLAVPAAGFLVRLFMIQHDCGHGSFFRRRWANDWTGRAIGVLTLTPYGYWRRSHAVHHASSGNLDRRGIGDITTLTVREYLACPRWRRLAYRLYRHPLVMFGIGPAYLFLVQQRFPSGQLLELALLA